ncbi:XdhC family protein [Rhodospirillum rubrum]|uniref:XdhC family protein n=1 Tax=Rhodospirillum rubrum TaxID=1085 RepID=UPI000037A4A2|nr:XdhC family protein [Rhodospirillum rubrum]AEO47469.1 hypothetical protein F11_04995 [Rhodospirillum rubrum F11]QXG81433.1 XdhC family protein [Rhodospirillum rubrum]
MDRSLLERLNKARAAKRPAVLVTALDGGAQALIIDGAPAGGTLVPEDALAQALAEGATGEIELAERRYFVQVFDPPRRLFLIGAVHIGQALAPMAAMAGFGVVIIDPRRAWATAERFPGAVLDPRWPDEALASHGLDRRSAVVTLTHDSKIDDPALVVALPSAAFYVAALGSPRTHGQRVERLTPKIGAAALARLKAPAGLDIGASTPAEIAVSVLAEMILALRGAKAARPPKDARP